MGTTAAEPVLVHAAPLSDLCLRALAAAGVDDGEARIVSDSLVDASLRGVDSHGVGLLPDYLERIAAGGWVTPNRVHVEASDGALVLLDGGASIGAVIATQGMRAAIDLAARYGVGLAAVRNASHFGAAGYYARIALEHDMIGCVFTNASPAMAPFGGRERLLSNNPWAIAVPSDDDCPLVMDIANSVVSRSRIRLAAQSGAVIPRGWAQAEDGSDTTDPALALAGAMVPFGAHKGYAIAFMVDAIAGVLSGSAFGTDVLPPFRIELSDRGSRDGACYRPQNVGHCFIAIDVGRMRSVAEFKHDVAAMARRIRESQPRPGVDRVMVPGDPECEAESGRRTNGIPVAATTLAALRAWADSLLPPR
jgi:LDH2 family malate/lactate/ureidoglycolate dehydrogenase